VGLALNERGGASCGVVVGVVVDGSDDDDEVRGWAMEKSMSVIEMRCPRSACRRQGMDRVPQPSLLAACGERWRGDGRPDAVQVSSSVITEWYKCKVYVIDIL